MKTVRIATRQSPLAMWQAEYVETELKKHHPDLQIELVPMTTKGDRILGTPLAKIGGKGLFVKELEQAMLDGVADIAVHSMKDVPYRFPEGLALNVICPRENPTDAFVSNHYSCLDAIPAGGVIGTSSMRRKVQILKLRPDLNIKDLRGNVGTRLSKLDNGDYDAIILASAGLIRLKLQERIRSEFTTTDLLPAPGQGAVGIEARANDPELDNILAPLNHRETQLRVLAERRITETLEASCEVPVAAFAELDDEQLTLKALVGAQDNRIISTKVSGKAVDAITIGNQAAEQLLELGAMEIVQSYKKA